MECKHVIRLVVNEVVLFIIIPMSLYYKNTRTGSGNLSAVPVRNVLHPKPYHTSQTIVTNTRQAIVTYTTKPASMFTRAKALADAADDQCSMSQSLECASNHVHLPKSFYVHSGFVTDYSCVV